jgi:hypothetical protein
MGLQLRITYKDKDYVYEILNNTSITKNTTELDIQLNGEKITLQKDDRKVWVQKEGNFQIDPEFAQALGRSVSLRFRM